MPNYRRAYVPGGTFFFTVVTYDRQAIFKEESAIVLLEQCLRDVAERHPFTVDAMVVLPDHLHTIWTLPEGDADFSLRWNQIKGDFSRRRAQSASKSTPASRIRKRERAVWQRRFWEHTIKDQEDFNRHRDYIHYNPIKHGLVRSPAEWEVSSFRRFVEMGFYEKDWGEHPDKALLEMDRE